MNLLILAAIFGLAALAIFLLQRKKQRTSPAKAVRREFKNEVDGRHHITKVFDDGLLVRRDFYGDYGAVYVTYFDAHGNPTRMQTWAETLELNQKRDGMVYTYYLSQITEYHPGTNVIKREFTMNETGKFIWDSSEFDTNGKITSFQRFYGDEGTLIEEVFLDADGKVFKTVPHKPDEGIRGQFAPEAIAWPDGFGEK